MPELTPDALKVAYQNGFFPMADDDGAIGWYTARRRTIFELDGFHVSKSLRKSLRRGRYRLSFDEDYEGVVQSCRRPEGTWISNEIVEAYCQAHRQGWGHSAEAWLGESLVGGVYGLTLGGAFFAESMFHTETDAGKLCLWALIDECRHQGFTLFDAQVMNPLLKTLGAKEISPSEYMTRLTAALGLQTDWGAA